MTNRERIETYDNREFARFLAAVAGYGGDKEEVDFWEDWLKKREVKGRKRGRMSKETISQTEGLCKEVANCIRNAYDRGYKQGFKDGNYDKAFFCNLNFEHGTNKGLNDAWEYARKIWRMSAYERAEIFHDKNCVLEHTASEAIQMIKEYEEKEKTDHEIKVGDEILIHNIQDAETYKAVVMDIDMDKGLWIFDENACNTVVEPNRYIGEEADIEVRKTGRTYPQIAEVLEQLKGE